MYKLLFDSDALIKISKAELIKIVVECFDVLITEEVYDETVKEGKKWFHPDADEIERLVKEGKIKILREEYYKRRKKPKQSFGLGETSVFQAYKKGNFVVTDDLSFLSYITKENIKNISPTHLLIILVKKGKLKKDEAYFYLEKLRPFIRKEVYELAKNDIKCE